MDPAADARLLAALVQRGHLPLEMARALDPELRSGAPLDELLVRTAGWSREAVQRARRTAAGARPEIPGYDVGERLGTGGTSDVFAAVERKTGARLALKVLFPSAARNPATLKSFVNEARRLAELDHPHIVKGRGLAKFPGFAPGAFVYFAALELVQGSTLLERLDAGERFREDELLGIVGQVADALDYLSQKGVVHRDVKPGNLMLTHDGVLKLIDLGFAAGAGERAAEGVAAGTSAYLDPQRAVGGAAADLRGDVYSLGVTLFHLRVGRLPFDATDDHELLRQHVMASLSSPEIKSRGVSPHLHYLIERMMSKDPDHRFQSWEELRREVEETRETLAKLDALDEPADAPSRKAPPRRRRF
ncbi:MAG: serine/threonine protein kinase [Planctomycetes bacterium]|nr:serine/threonine protein kinase [Planctomycetota bacterium]